MRFLSLYATVQDATSRLLRIALILGLFSSAGRAELILFESGALGRTGVTWDEVLAGNVPSSSISPAVFSGVRFELAHTVATSKIGVHLVGSSVSLDTCFGAIVALEDQADFPDSENLSTPDVLGHTIIPFPEVSKEVFGELDLVLAPGWYAIVLGSGLFDTTGNGAMPLNNPDLGSPDYVARQLGAGWFDLSDLSDVRQFDDYRFTLVGQAIPEPNTLLMGLIGLGLMRTLQRSIGRSAIPCSIDR
ncbi:hypothetical protein [Aeoliella mucimassa]|uniref:PEP-CTERM protein-sorting domain-containing protein n=1 Tax=Aeoliella mucimassa TaxID=2527972 RepID=A0A518AW33_9BACT|nr:hypothetical protein [Aeoliella mucimassa]QDU58916.1 hypothetical protein Pan181_51570 [Aeoliella mucimassa]